MAGIFPPCECTEGMQKLKSNGIPDRHLKAWPLRWWPFLYARRFDGYNVNSISGVCAIYKGFKLVRPCRGDSTGSGVIVDIRGRRILLLSLGKFSAFRDHGGACRRNRKIRIDIIYGACWNRNCRHQQDTRQTQSQRPFNLFHFYTSFPCTKMGFCLPVFTVATVRTFILPISYHSFFQKIRSFARTVVFVDYSVVDSRQKKTCFPEGAGLLQFTT